MKDTVQVVKDFFATLGRGDTQAMFALAADDIEWIIPGEDWPLAGTRRGHAGLADLLRTASETVVTTTEPREVPSVAEAGRRRLSRRRFATCSCSDEMGPGPGPGPATWRNGRPSSSLSMGS